MIVSHKNGFLAYKIPDEDTLDERPHLTYFIHTLEVHPSHQGRGIGSWLLTELKRLHPDACIGLHTNGSAALRRFYERNGFVFEGDYYAEYSPSK